MSKDLEETIDEKLITILNLIRTNSKADDVVKLAQGFQYVVNGKVALEGKATTRKQGAGAS